MEEINIGLRKEQLRHLQEYVKDIDKDITLILQSLQWDRKHLQLGEQKVTCKYDSNHRIPADNVKEHEEKCYLKSQNYVPGDLFFPEPLDANAVTVVKLSAENINDIINYAVKTDSSFKRSSESVVPSHAPLTLDRLQAAHSADERRALYDAVAAAAPPPAPLGRDPALDGPPATSACEESRGDAMLALRDARRRRARHRGAARDTYQHELRGLISAQMELFTGEWNDEDADNKPDVTIDESDDGRRCGRESDRRDRVRNDCRSKYLNPTRREHGESRDQKRKEYERDNRGDKRREYERDNIEDKRREYERDNRDDKRREYGRDNREDKRREYEKDNREDKRRKYERDNREDKRREYEIDTIEDKRRDNREDKRREYERESREDKRRVYEYDKKYKETNKLCEHDDRKRPRQYDKECWEIKQEKDDPAEIRKREERRYDYKDRKRETDRSSSRDNKKYHKREKRHHKQKSAERRRGRSRDSEYDRNYKNDIDCSYLRIKKEPPDYN